MFKNFIQVTTLALVIGYIVSIEPPCDMKSTCGCASKSRSVVRPKIAGGIEAVSSSWDWVVSLQKNNEHTCGATLINDEIAVTGASCIINLPISSLSILAGTRSLSKTSGTDIRRRSIAQITIHPEYNKTNFMNDIALIRFKTLNAIDDSKLAPICLPAQGQDLFKVGDNLVALGWGSTTETDVYPSDALRQVTVKSIAFNDPSCTSSIVDQTSQFCASASVGEGIFIIYNDAKQMNFPFKTFFLGTCYGDGGGPLMAFIDEHWVLAGITSFGKKCGDPSYADVYTRVSSFTAFIEKFVGKQ